MSDPRIATVAGVLQEAGATSSPDDTDTVALKIINALDAQHGAPPEPAQTFEGATGEAGAGGGTGELATGNPETPVGTGTEGGGAGTPA